MNGRSCLANACTVLNLIINLSANVLFKAISILPAVESTGFGAASIANASRLWDAVNSWALTDVNWKLDVPKVKLPTSACVGGCFQKVHSSLCLHLYHAIAMVGRLAGKKRRILFVTPYVWSLFLQLFLLSISDFPWCNCCWLLFKPKPFHVCVCVCARARVCVCVCETVFYNSLFY